MAGEIEAVGGNLLQYHSVHHKSQIPTSQHDLNWAEPLMNESKALLWFTRRVFVFSSLLADGAAFYE
jgi:hypothetical protein